MATTFDKYKILHGFPKVGQKVKYVKPTKVHWFTNVVEDEKRLTLYDDYTVSKTELNSSSSYIWLEEFPQEKDNGTPFFNLGAFDWIADIPQASELVGFSVLDLFRLSGKTGCRVVKDTYEVFYGDELLFTPIYDKVTGVISGFVQDDYKGADSD